MANIIDVLKKFIRPYYYYIIVLIVLIIFLVIGINWLKNQKGQLKKFNNVSNENRRNKEANIYFFHVDWCPHCKTALPEWKSFMNQYNGVEINGYVIKCIDIDCTTETSDVKSAMNKFNISSYPTVKLIKDENIIDFDSKITKTSLSSFVNTMLNQ
jgi:thiol-disulfide isomerase/thioredoxin